MPDPNLNGIDPLYHAYDNPNPSSADSWNPGGASSLLRGGAAQLMTGNEGTVQANLFRQGAERGGDDLYQRLMAANAAGGGGNNYNAMASVARGVQGNVNQQALKAYGQAADINSRNVAEGGRLAGQADQLDQQGKESAFKNYLESTKQDQLNPGWGELALQDQQHEDFLPGLAKGLFTGLAGVLTGGAAGALSQSLFGYNQQRQQRQGPPNSYGYGGSGP